MVRSFRPALLCAATFLAPLAASAGEITLFEDAGFRGRPVTLRSDAGDLSRMGFNDKTSSIIVRSGTWEVCKDANYRGNCRTLGPGRYDTMPGMNDAVSSVREVGRPGHGGGDHRPYPPRPNRPYPEPERPYPGHGHGGGHRPDMNGAVLMFPDAGMRGRPVRLDREVRDLSRYGFNDRAESIVVNYGRWEFCVDANFRGRCVVMGPGSYGRLHHGLDRRISSLRRVR
ncbi:beta/gamma crystallin-related protein [Janthinobacterium sp. P210005]|uniref:beta/gamma crystallin-related protein n=1 Tax=Janthinobacterium sp. P210005 TaxID=3112938 RepID=UPI002E2713E0|nr:beta/gamma crystallin-related protein [Janthinobacterium sp. P210005]